jgi:hypothetical protein
MRIPARRKERRGKQTTHELSSFNIENHSVVTCIRITNMKNVETIYIFFELLVDCHITVNVVY